MVHNRDNDQHPVLVVAAIVVLMVAFMGMIFAMDPTRKMGKTKKSS
jgi:hypothetical protein